MQTESLHDIEVLVERQENFFLCLAETFRCH